jgi:hypothetical protein
VAGFEIRLGDEARQGDTYVPSGRPNWPHRNRKHYSGRIGLLEVGVNMMRSYGDSYAAYPDDEKGFMALNYNSQSLTFNIASYSSSFTRSGWLGATMAIGVTYSWWDLDKPVALAKIDRRLHPAPVEGEFKVSRLRYWGLHAPLVLEINPSRNFFVSAGGYMDVMLSSSAKWKHPKHKFADPYINPLQLGLTARAGFRDFYFWGKYSFSDFFQAGKGPRLNPYTIGIGLGF